MEVGRRKLSSENEFRERRRSSDSKKKREALPLAMILSFNDKDVHPDCPNVSNPYHKCGRHCLDRIPSAGNFLEAIRSDGDRELEKSSDKTGVNLKCPQASTPYHKCAEYCSDKLSQEKRRDAEKNQPGINPKEEKKEILPTEGVKLACIYASNPFHVCADYCFQTVAEEDQPGQSMKLEGFNQGEKVLSTKEKTGFHPQCKHAPNRNGECTESCFQSVTDRIVAEGAANPKEQSEIIVTVEQRVNLEYKNASNPSHGHPGYCSESVTERDRYEEAIKKLKEVETVVLPSERGVNPECKFASNPYHVCAEYCFQNVLKWEHHGQFMKLKSIKELKNLVSNKKITSGHPQCEYASNPYHKCAEYCFNKNIPVCKNPDGALKIIERKKGKSYALRRDDNPKYQNISNSFHGCAKYCPEDISPKSEAMAKEKKRDSSEGNKRDHLVEKISLNSKYMEASKSSHNYIEASEGIILQDGTEKRSMDSNYVETFNPTNNNLQDASKDLQSAIIVDIWSRKVPTDMPTLHIDSSDLFQEWARYCSQTKDADGEIGMGEFSTNGIGNSFLKDYDSANIEKRRTRKLKG